MLPTASAHGSRTRGFRIWLDGPDSRFAAPPRAPTTAKHETHQEGNATYDHPEFNGARSTCPRDGHLRGRIAPRRHRLGIAYRTARSPADDPTLWIMAILLTFGGFFDGYAIGLIGALGPGLFKAQIFSPTTVSFFGLTGFASFVAALFAGFFLASLFVSYVADHLGRRAIFAYSLLWFGVANFIMAMQTTADGVNFWRFISALGVGLELVTVDAYLSELVPKKSRGAAFAFLQAMSAIAFLVSYFLSWQLIPTNLFGYDGWRWVTWVGSIAAVVIWWIRLGLPESPRWLAQQGRLQEAERVMADIEASVSADIGGPLPAPASPHYQDPRKGSIKEIFSPRYRKRTIMLMLFNFFQTVGFYGFVAWTPTLLIAKGIHVTQSLEYSTIINVAAVAFPLLIMSFADKLERKWHACLSCLVHRRVWHLVRQCGWNVGADRVGGVPRNVGAVAVVRAAQLPGGTVSDAHPRPWGRVRLFLEQTERDFDAVLHRVLPA